jgi:hypothetical protein
VDQVKTILQRAAAGERNAGLAREYSIAGRPFIRRSGQGMQRSGEGQMGRIAMSNFMQTAIEQGPNLVLMTRDMGPINVEKDDPDGIIMTCSDGTYGAYAVEELLDLRPYRERVQVVSRLAVRNKG